MQPLLQVSSLIQAFLGVEDTNNDISKFVVSLYDKAAEQASSSGNTASVFNTLLAENGGEFPQEFINKVIDLLDEPPPIKQEPTEAFDALTIPDKKVEFVEPDTTSSHPVKDEPQIKQQYTQDDFSEVVPGKVYRGVITNITNFGAFVKVKYLTGLCHISQLSFDNSVRIRSPHDIVKSGQEVHVKVLSIEEESKSKRGQQKVSLSMRGIDQLSGVDHSEELERGRQLHQQPHRPQKRRLTSPEKWEIRQMIASGTAKAEDYPELNDFEDLQSVYNDEKEVHLEIELNFQEPNFLKGQTHDLESLEPPKIIRNPEGSMRRAALKGSSLAKEVKDKRVKEQREKDKEERIQQSRRLEGVDPMGPTSIDPKLSHEQIALEWRNSQKKVTYGKRTSLSMKQQRESLPVFTMRAEIVDLVNNNQFLVVVGETGSGKTTQIVQYLAEEGLNINSKGHHKIIGCTQPRRVAAQSVAKRVAEERGTRLGEDVGYNVRFDDKSSPSTNIKYMTDGMLQREAINDPAMGKYSVIMLDEAHERTIATDVLFALLKKATLVNPDLKVIVTSATLDSKKFSRYFNNCPVLKIPGRTFPVEVLYTKEPEMDYLSAALDSVIQIHVSEPEGDILVFLTGQDEIDTGCEILYEKAKALGDTIQELIILPVYSSLPSEVQSRIFEPTPKGSRKVILATNIAETSITIDGVFYVIDPGFVKINAYDPKLGMDSLVVSPISQASANQRSGRAGRTGPGKCYRLYTEKAYNEEMLPNTIPEIQRTNLSNTILLLKAMGINDLMNFEFMDPPKTHTMLSALQELYVLEALDDNGYLTRLGKKMSDLPMEPKLAKTVIKSIDYECSEEVLTIVSMLSVQNVFYRPKQKQSLADQRRARFNHSSGDHLTLLNVYRSWALNGYNRTWCQENFIQERSMRRAQEVKSQLSKIMHKNNSPILSCAMDTDRVLRALCSGFFKNSAKRDHQDGYKTLVENTPVYLHPSSALQNKDPDYVIYHTLVLTSREYMHCASAILPQQLMEAAPTYFSAADAANPSKRHKIVPLHDKFRTEDAWRLSSHISHKKSVLGDNRNK
ncbi:DEAH-box ATP-dependent RNA helicase prp22 [Yamadazyma tenuis]|uniref:DEAH-box ATP-dependent RNA helicase prp22 n=1 Tax=Candida tenuis TaxID=2315449 RepID=UPI0027A81EA8|nr:DEAH-box ATP-dependent RNA helicase prp22 [Yamadazyma tenuis]